MAAQKDSYPVIPTKHWWALRDKFKASMPRTVTAGYVSTALGMQEVSATNNILPCLRAIGLIDKESTPTDLANRWRDDAEYADVCQEIRGNVYPQELLDAVHDVPENRSGLQSWFKKKTHAGESAAKKMTAFYLLLLQADPSKVKSGVSRPAKGAPRKPKVRRGQGRSETGRPDGLVAKPDRTQGGNQGVPDVSINVQVLISADASPEQIDQVFASMAKHIYRKS